MGLVTGTATLDTANFIIDNHKLINYKTIKTSLFRTNVTIEVLEKKDKANMWPSWFEAGLMVCVA